MKSFKKSFRQSSIFRSTFAESGLNFNVCKCREKFHRSVAKSIVYRLEGYEVDMEKSRVKF